jgi:nicotinamide riboside transporter PnuC
VIWGIVAFAFSLVTGIGYYAWEQKGLGEADASGDTAEVRRRLNRYYLVGRIDSLVLVSAVFAMTAKPWL